MLMWEGKYAYCLFCRCGAEKALAQLIELTQPEITAKAAFRDKHRRCKGVSTTERSPFMQGYVFLYADSPIERDTLRKFMNAYRLLDYYEGDTAELHGGDLEFAKWIYENDGIIGISTVRTEKGATKVLSGPMLRLADSVVRFDKHTRNALVRISFLDRTAELWLPFAFEGEQSAGSDA